MWDSGHQCSWASTLCADPGEQHRLTFFFLADTHSSEDLGTSPVLIGKHTMRRSVRTEQIDLFFLADTHFSEDLGTSWQEANIQNNGASSTPHHPECDVLMGGLKRVGLLYGNMTRGRATNVCTKE